MNNINSVAFRKRLAQHLTECEESGEPLMVTTSKNGREDQQQMVVMSKAKFDELTEDK